MMPHHNELIKQNPKHLENMLDFAIQQLVEIAEDNEIWLMDNGRICLTYEDIFNCLKHYSEKKMEQD